MACRGALAIRRTQAAKGPSTFSRPSWQIQTCCRPAAIRPSPPKTSPVDQVVGARDQSAT